MANKNNKRVAQPAVKKAVQKGALPNNAAVAQPKMTKDWKFSLQFKFALLLGIISLLVYANTLKNGYVLDDFTVIKGNVIVSKGMDAIPEILSTPYRRGYFVSSNDLYRPLSLVMFAVEYQLFGLNPMPNHLINILLFAGCVILLFFFLDSLFEKTKTGIAAIASLLFALHPIHTEVVANIKSRDELLCFFFSFLSLNIFLKYQDKGKILQLLTGALCFFLALMSKETVITFLAVIPLVFFFYRDENSKRAVSILIASAVVAVVFLVIRSSVLNFYHANEVATIKGIDNALAIKGLSIESRLATAILILGYYIKLLFIPYPLISDYSYHSIPFTHFSDPVVLLSLLLYLFLVAFGIIRLLKYRKDIIAFSILFYLITMSLFSNIFFLIGTALGERLLFFPSVGFTLIIAFLIARFLAMDTGAGLDILKNKKVLALIVPIAMVFAVITWGRNNDWTSNYTLYSADLKKSPDNSRLYYGMATELGALTSEEKDPVKQRKMTDTVISYYKKALAIYPDYSEAECNLGYEFFSISQYDSAEYHEKKSIELTHRQINAINNLAAIYINERKFREALDLCKSAVEMNPLQVTPYINIAACYLNLNKYDSGITASRQAINADPSVARPYLFLSIAYKALGKLDSAKIYEDISKTKSN